MAFDLLLMPLIGCLLVYWVYRKWKERGGYEQDARERARVTRKGLRHWVGVVGSLALCDFMLLSEFYGTVDAENEEFIDFMLAVARPAFVVFASATCILGAFVFFSGGTYKSEAVLRVVRVLVFVFFFIPLGSALPAILGIVVARLLPVVFGWLACVAAAIACVLPLPTLWAATDGMVRKKEGDPEKSAEE